MGNKMSRIMTLPRSLGGYTLEIVRGKLQTVITPHGREIWSRGAAIKSMYDYPWDVLWPHIHDRRQKGASIAKIAEEIGIPFSVVYRAVRLIDGGVSPKDMKQLRGVDTKSICPVCVHAYGDDCFAVDQRERTWIKKAMPGTYNGLVVLDCARFEVGRKPLATTRYVGAILDRIGGQHHDGNRKRKA